jgi:hypothetical protein
MPSIRLRASAFPFHGFFFLHFDFGIGGGLLVRCRELNRPRKI